MRKIVLAGLALTLATAAAARSEPDDRLPDQWDCQAAARGEGGGEVQVDLYVEADGAVVARTASWDPPRVWSGAPAKGLFDPAPDLTVIYVAVTPHALGAPEMVMISAAGDPRHVRLDGLAASLVFDAGEAQWRTNLEVFPTLRTPDGARSGFASGVLDRYSDGSGADLMAAIGAGGTGVATLNGRKGAVLASARFDFSAKAQRDALFGKAMAQAEAAAKAPTKCLKTEEGDGKGLPTTPVP